MENFLFSEVQGKGCSSTWPDPENRVGGQENVRQGRAVSAVLQVTGEPGCCHARTRIY
jgi:hypothetical protein